MKGRQISKFLNLTYHFVSDANRPVKSIGPVDHSMADALNFRKGRWNSFFRYCRRCRKSAKDYSSAASSSLRTGHVPKTRVPPT